MIGGIIFTIIGLAVVIPMISKHNGPVWFGVLWTLAAFAGTIMGAINAFSDKGIPTVEIVVPEDEAKTKSTEDRLRELDELLQKKVINYQEYSDTRKRILDDH